MAEKEDKIIIKQFRDSSSNFWVDGVHYHLNKNGEIEFCAGGIDKEELREYLLSYIKRNKKQFKERSPSIFENEPKQYLEILPCTELKGRTVSEAFELNKNLLKWFLTKYSFKSGEEKLKEQVIEILKR